MFNSINPTTKAKIINKKFPVCDVKKLPVVFNGKISETKMKHTENLQQELYNEITGRLDKEESSVPYFLDGYFYSQRFEKGYEYPFFTRKKESLEADEEILINQNLLAKNQPFCEIKPLKDNG